MVSLRAGMIIFALVAAGIGKEPDSDRPNYPLLIRLDQAALQPLRAKDIRHEGQVDRMILGTRAVGRSWTSGAFEVQPISESDDAAVTVRFQGRSQTRTTGTNGPALIHSRTFTDFNCARKIVFVPRQGLVPGPAVIQSKTTLVYDGVESARGGIGRRLVARVAQRRANESYDAARAIAQRDNEAAILRAFEQRLDEKLATINRQLAIVRELKTALISDASSRVSACSCQGGLLIGIGSEASTQGVKVAAPKREQTSPIEIWLHCSLGGEGVTRLATLLEDMKAKMPSEATRFLIAQGSLPEVPAPQPFKLDFQDGWLILGLSGDSPEPATLALWTAVDLAQRVPRSGADSLPTAQAEPAFARLPSVTGR